MIKKTITFQDLDGNPRTGDFYFNLSRAEIIRNNIRNMNLGADGTPDVEAFKSQLEQIINSKSGAVIMDTFEDIIRQSYGERDADGITFNKSEELSRKFMNTDAYEVLFLEIITNAGVAAEFINGIMPANLNEALPEPVKDDVFEAFPEAKPVTVPTRTPLGLAKDPALMSREELLAAVQAQTSKGGE